MKRSETRLLLEAFSMVTYKRVLFKKWIWWYPTFNEIYVQGKIKYLLLHNSVSVLVQEPVTLVLHLLFHEMLWYFLLTIFTWSAKCLTRKAVCESRGLAKCSHLVRSSCNQESLQIQGLLLAFLVQLFNPRLVAALRHPASPLSTQLLGNGSG